MEIQMTEQVAKIFEETEKMTLTEKQSLFWIMVEKWGQENVFQIHHVNWNQNALYIELPNKFDWEDFGNEILESRKSKNNEMLNRISNFNF